MQLVMHLLIILNNRYAFTRPNRGNLDDPNVKWRYGKPNYDLADITFLQGKTQSHKTGKQKSFATEIVCSI